MLSLGMNGPLRILCLGAHCDDIEIGCGATLMHLANHAHDVAVRWAVFSGNDIRHEEARASAAEFLQGVPDRAIDLKNFRESFFPTQRGEIKEEFERLRARFDPNIVFTHFKNDDHQDHRLIAELTWNTFRDHLILEYEIPKFEDDLGKPNVFFPVERETVVRKVEALRRHYRSQRQRSWFTDDTFMGLMRIRGVNANAPSGFAEAFHCRKLLVA